MNADDSLKLAGAATELERQNLGVSIANRIGVPLDMITRRLPAQVQSALDAAVRKALEQCLNVAIREVNHRRPEKPSNRTHKLLTAATGATGGFFGIAGLLVELPVSTTLMLHSIAEIARSHGEDLSRPEAALSCIEVLALGPDAGKPHPVDSAYYATRAGLAQALRDASSYLAQRGTSGASAPAVVRFLSGIGARFGVEVSEKAAAQLVPIAGAVGGMALNVLFTAHFQRLAEGHFTVRELERIYGAEAVQQEYDRLRAAQMKV